MTSNRGAASGNGGEGTAAAMATVRRYKAAESTQRRFLSGRTGNARHTWSEATSRGFPRTCWLPGGIKDRFVLEPFEKSLNFNVRL